MRKGILLALLFLPVVASAAGFAKQSLFLSKAAVNEGDTVIIHAVISSESAFAGTLALSDAEGAIGTVPVKLSTGEAQAVSVSWKPSGGSHTVLAELKNGTTVVERQSATFYITPKPQPVSTPVPAQPAAVESSQNIQDSIAGVSPQAAEVTAPFFTLVDSARSSASDIIATQLAKTKTSLGPQAGQVLGAEATKDAASNPGGTFWFILQTIYLYILTVLGYIVGSAGIFYPLFAIAVLYLLWKLFNRFRRPAY